MPQAILGRSLEAPAAWVILCHCGGPHYLSLPGSLRSNISLSLHATLGDTWIFGGAIPCCSFPRSGHLPRCCPGAGHPALDPSPSLRIPCLVKVHQCLPSQVSLRAIPCLLLRSLNHLRGFRLLKTKPGREVICRQLLSAPTNLLGGK